MKTSEFIWMNGDLVKWDDARIHVLSHVVHYGSSVFEGMRAYKSDRGAILFRLREHSIRIINSAKIYRMELDYTPEQIDDIVAYAVGRKTLAGAPAINHETLAAKGFDDAAIQRVDDGHIFGRQLKVEDLCVFAYTLLLAGFGNDHHASLHQPAQSHLYGRLAVFLAQLLHQVGHRFGLRRGPLRGVPNGPLLQPVQDLLAVGAIAQHFPIALIQVGI